MYKLTSLPIIIIFCLIKPIFSARILYISPTPSFSHHIFHRQILKELLNRGHEILSVTPNPMNNPALVNLTEINVHNETYGEYSISKWLEEFQTRPESAISKGRRYLPHLKRQTDKILTRLKWLISDTKEQFDVIIVEMIVTAAYFAFKERFKCPIIGITSMDTTISGMDAIGNPSHPGYYGNIYALGAPDLNFWERLDLLWHNIYYRAIYFGEYIPNENELVRRHFNIDTDAWELKKSVDLVLSNTNPVFHMSKPIVPIYIQIGGLHHSEDQPLPKDLKEFLDKSTKGVVYFSFGSNIRSDSIPSHIGNSFMEAFKKLPYNIVWKRDNSSFPDKPSKVFTQSWMPQQQVLDHPNVVAFVTHAGLHSVEEAIRSHVPMVGIPYGGDQLFNARRLESLKIGRQLLFTDITTDTLTDAITDIATNPEYKKNIEKVSEWMEDQPMKPMDRTMWWIEYIIRHRGAKHLRCPAADFSWPKYLLLDLIGFILGVFIFITFLIIFVVRFLLFKMRKLIVKSKKHLD